MTGIKANNRILVLLAFFGAGLLMLPIIGLVRECHREQTGNSQPVPAEQARQRIINTDSIRSAIEAEYRNRELAIIKQDSIKRTEWMANYKPIAQSAATAVIRYQKQPTLANCDSAVKKLVIQVSELETGMAISDTIIGRQRNVINSFAGTVARKDSTIRELSEGWEECNEREAELQKKLRRKNKLLKIGAGVLALLIGAVALK